MRVAVRCDQCGRSIPLDAPDRQCPACLWQLGLAAGSASLDQPAAAVPEAPTTLAAVTGGEATVSFGAASHADPTASPEAGVGGVRRLGNYDLLAELGRGGMGVVYKAVQRRADRVVALKLILGGAASSQADRERFLAEVQSLAKLRHPSIVPIFEVGEEDGCPYFSMEYVGGGTLVDRMRESLLSPAEAALIVQQLAGAVEQAHRMGILHRDIKPGNVLLDEHGNPRLTDFGLAKRLDDDQGLTRTGAVLGTPAYMPPEQAAGEAELTPAADVYALGATLYALLTGRPPFSGKNALETIHRVLRDEPRLPRTLRRDLSRDLEAICLRCLEKNPAHRYASAQALADDLASWRDGRSTVARPLSWPQRMGRRARRHWRRAAAVLALGISAALLASVLWPSDPATQVDRDLLRGGEVILIPERGGPRWHQWAVGTGETSSPDTNGVFQVLSLNRGYLELARQTHHRRFRLSAEFTAQQSITADSRAGVYFARTPGAISTAGSVERLIAVELRDDLVNNLPMNPKGDPLNVNDYLLISSSDVPLSSVPRNLAVLWMKEVKLPLKRTWRKLVIEVDGQSLRVQFQADVHGPSQQLQPTPVSIDTRHSLTAAEIERLQQQHGQLEFHSPDFDPTGGIGLCVSNARVFFRNVRIEPLP